MYLLAEAMRIWMHRDPLSYYHTVDIPHSNNVCECVYVCTYL